jgi:hypothetical protein
MISRAPLLAASEASGIAEKLRAYVATSIEKAADGLTLAEFGELLLAGMRTAISVLDDFTGLSGEQKKTVVLDLVGDLFDALADKAVPAYAWPLWVIAKPTAKSLLLAIASGVCEALLPLVRLAEAA